MHGTVVGNSSWATPRASSPNYSEIVTFCGNIATEFGDVVDNVGSADQKAGRRSAFLVRIAGPVCYPTGGLLCMEPGRVVVG